MCICCFRPLCPAQFRRCCEALRPGLRPSFQRTASTLRHPVAGAATSPAWSIGSGPAHVATLQQFEPGTRGNGSTAGGIAAARACTRIWASRAARCSRDSRFVHAAVYAIRMRVHRPLRSAAPGGWTHQASPSVKATSSAVAGIRRPAIPGDRREGTGSRPATCRSTGMAARD